MGQIHGQLERLRLYAACHWGKCLMGDHLGYVDTANGRDLYGWAADLRDPSQPVGVEVRMDGKIVAETRADQHRPDLAARGFGSGHHGFLITLPPQVERGKLATVTVRVQGTEYLLTHNGKDKIELDFSQFIEWIAGDLVNNCNLRCPFCLVDYSHVTKTEIIKEETFRKLLPLMRAVPAEGFWLSCLHEPTLHPKLNRLLSLIPPESRSKAWFTTNLAKPLAAEEFEGWAESRIHHINISFDTAQPELFAVLRKHGRYAVFEKNLKTLVKVFRKYRHAPRLRYITMAFKSNLPEIPELVRRCHEEFLGEDHEIRFTYNMEHIADEFRRTQYLSKDDWATLTSRLAQIPYPYRISYPPSDEWSDVEFQSANYFDIKPRPPVEPLLEFPRPLRLRFRPDGTLLLAADLEDRFRVNVHELDDPVAFFREKLAEPVA